MYRLIVLIAGLVVAGPAWAVCPSTPGDCPSGTANNWTVANALSVTGASTLSGGGTLTGTFTGGTFSGITLSGTIAGSPTFSGALTFNSSVTLGTNNTNLQFTDTAGLHPVFVSSSGDSFQFKGTNATSGTTPIFSIPQHTDTHTMTINVPLTVQGPITGGKTFVYSGTQGPTNATALWSNVNVSGAATDPNAYAMNLIQTTDTVVGQLGSSRGLFNVTYTAGVGSVSAAWAVDVFSKTAGLTGDLAAGGSFGMGAGRFNGTATFNQGGTSTAAVSGSVWGLNVQANALGTATFMTAIRGIEINMGIGSTASAQIKQALKLTNQGSADVTDAFGLSSFVAMGIGSVTASKMRDGIQFAGYSDFVWGWDGGSKLIDASRWSNAYFTVAQNADAGFDAYAVAFTSNFLRANGSNGPWLVDGNGAMQIGTARFTPSSAGLTVDAVGAYGTGTPTVTAGGSGYVNNDLLFYGTGGVAQITGVSGGAVTSITVLRQPYLTSTSTPANPLATTTDWRSTGTGATLTQSWNTTANLLKLNPSGNTVVGTGSALATNATSGMLLIPSMAGTPTGTVGALGGVALNYDSTNKKLCVSIGATVECSAAFTP